MTYREQATIIGKDHPCWCRTGDNNTHPPSVYFNAKNDKAECYGCLLWRFRYTSKEDVEAVQCEPGVYEDAERDMKEIEEKERIREIYKRYNPPGSFEVWAGILMGALKALFKRVLRRPNN